MWPTKIIGAGILLASLVTSYPHYPHPPHLQQLGRRAQYVTSVSSDGYDFVIVGGGLAGLVLASRLSDDSNKSVLVIEAGDSGELVQDRLNVPAKAYYEGLLGSSYDWGYKTVPQANTGNRQISWPRGKLLGGSAAVNGMYLVYPTEIECNAWRDLLATDDKEAAEAWGWDQFSTAMRKSETFVPPVDNVKAEDSIEYEKASRGSSGPIFASYPGYGFSVIGDFITSLTNVGIAQCPDAGAGENWGGFVTTSAINPTNWTRSYSRNAYIDPLPPRPNLTILVNATVTKIDFSKGDGGLTATGVQYVSLSDSATHTVNAKKEVILSAGAVGSPQLLLVSGVGPSDVLNAAGVTVHSELPGVGQHLQDHVSTPVIWNSSYQTAGAIHAANSDTSAEFMSYVNSAISYTNLTTVFGSGLSDVINNIMSTLDSSVSSVPSSDPTVIAGYKAIYQATAQKLLDSPVGAIEMILNLAAPGSIGVIVGLQHPLSHGRLYINSSSVFDSPLIDPNYFAHPVDKTIFREGVKLARKLGSTAPLNAALQAEITPGTAIQSDEDWDNWAVNAVSTEYHPSGSCSMLPKSLGGVVDAKLQVYGTTNLRVIDSSVYPISFSAHLMTPTYGLAEKAAEIIHAAYSSSSNSSSSGSDGSSSSPNKDGGGASALLPVFSRTLLCLAVVGFLFTLY